MPRVVIIYNPIAGGSRGGAVSARVEERLREAGHEVERMPTRDRLGATPLAAEVRDRADWVVAVGGDGTVREVVDGLGDRRGEITIGVVPMGNANIVAHELGVPTRHERAIDVLLQGRAVQMDIGAVRSDDFDELFLGVVGVGWDADAVRMLDRMRHTPLGKRGYRLWADGLYGVTGLAAALRLDPAWFTIEKDGAPISSDRYCAAFLCNLRTYAKGLTVTPDAHRASGMIHLQARKSSLPPALVLQMSAALLRKRTPRLVSDYAEGRRFTLRAERPFPVQVDGDARAPTSWIEVEVIPSAIRVIAPDTER